MTWNPLDDLKVKAKELCVKFMKQRLDEYIEHRGSSNMLQDLFYAIACMSNIKVAAKDAHDKSPNIDTSLLLLFTERLMQVYAEFALAVVYSALKDGAPEETISKGFKTQEEHDAWVKKVGMKKAGIRTPIDFDHIADDLNLPKGEKDDEVH